MVALRGEGAKIGGHPVQRVRKGTSTPGHPTIEHAIRNMCGRHGVWARTSSSKKYIAADP